MHQLQENVCVSISNEDFEIELLYENGINNGALLNEYSINPLESFTNDTREHEVIVDIVLDIEVLKGWASYAGRDLVMKKAKILLHNNKAKILEMIRNESYDNYVTGGGTNKTNSFYKEKMKEFTYNGIQYWKVKTKTETAQAYFI